MPAFDPDLPCGRCARGLLPVHQEVHFLTDTPEPVSASRIQSMSVLARWRATQSWLTLRTPDDRRLTASVPIRTIKSINPDSQHLPPVAEESARRA
jgi:hypothetical protein